MTDLLNRRILIVEDEPLVAMALEDILTDLGCAVVGPATGLANGLAMAGALPIDAALLDVNLCGEESFPIARLLAERAIPYVFTTGYGDHGLPPGEDVPVIAKPYRAYQIRDVLTKMLSPA